MRPKSFEPYHLGVYMEVRKLVDGPEKLTIEKAVRRLQMNNLFTFMTAKQLRGEYDAARKHETVVALAEQLMAEGECTMTPEELEAMARGYDDADKPGKPFGFRNKANPDGISVGMADKFYRAAETFSGKNPK